MTDSDTWRAIDVLKERFARDEISVEDLERAIRVILNGSPFSLARPERAIELILRLDELAPGAGSGSGRLGGGVSEAAGMSDTQARDERERDRIADELALERPHEPEDLRRAIPMPGVYPRRVPLRA